MDSGMAELTADEEKRRQIVTDMHLAFSDIDADYLTGLFTDDGVVHMVMLDPIAGRDDLHAMFVRWRDDYPNIHSELVYAVVEDEAVLTHWVEHYDWNGKRYDIPIMGVVDFDGLRIRSWRLFFDRIMANMVGGQYPDFPG
jgi:limonene-1,2-epoxide hydrolase